MTEERLCDFICNHKPDLRWNCWPVLGSAFSGCLPVETLGYTDDYSVAVVCGRCLQVFLFPFTPQVEGNQKPLGDKQHLTLLDSSICHPPVIHAWVSFTRRCRSAFCRRDGTFTDGGTQREWERTAVSSKCNGGRDWSQNSASIISQPKLTANVFIYVRTGFILLN